MEIPGIGAMRSAPAIGNPAGKRPACRLEVAGELFWPGRQRRARTGERRLVIRAGRSRFAIEVGHVQRDLVDDLGLAIDRQPAAGDRERNGGNP